MPRINIEDELRAEIHRRQEELQAANLRWLELENALSECRRQCTSLSADLRVVTDALNVHRASLAELHHDLSSPLAAIVTWTEILREDAVDEPTRAQAVSILARSAEALAEVLRASRNAELA